MPESMLLRVTRRCLREDLEFQETDLALPMEELAARHPMIRAFVEQRSQSAIGQETIQGLTAKIVAFSLHFGEDRGITWHHEKAGVVWLLASAFHRSGQRGDAYPYFRELDAKGLLLPAPADFQALTESQASTLARSLITDVPRLLREARRSRGQVVRGLIGGRISVRLMQEDGERPMLTVAISLRIWPGEMTLSADWLMSVAAAFFPHTRTSDLSTAFDIGGRPITPDEQAFCDFVPLDV
jgi:hypothetical protein